MSSCKIFCIDDNKLNLLQVLDQNQDEIAFAEKNIPPDDMHVIHQPVSNHHDIQDALRGAQVNAFNERMQFCVF